MSRFLTDEQFDAAIDIVTSTKTNPNGDLMISPDADFSESTVIMESREELRNGEKRMVVRSSESNKMGVTYVDEVGGIVFVPAKQGTNQFTIKTTEGNVKRVREEK